MSRTTRAAAFIVLLAVISSAAFRPRQDANPHAVALAHFEERIKQYLALRDKVEANLTPPKPSANAQKIEARQQSLAAGVRAARAEARAGDVFGQDAAPILRDAIRRDFSQRTPRERAAVLQEVPEGLGLKVNSAYPTSVPLATVPPKLLAELPRLPESLEYRFVGRRLILHDTVTNLVVDILDAAVPAQ